MSNTLKKIHIPNKIIANRDFPHKAIQLYYELRNISNKDNKCFIYTDNLLQKLNWSKTETLKKYLIVLYKYNLIKEDYNKMPKFKPLEITFNLELNNNEQETNYTQVDIYTIEKIKETIQDKTDMAIRLYYFLQKNNNTSLGYSYPEYEDIIEQTKISGKNIVFITNKFEENKLLKIDRGYMYIENETGRSKKTRNQYTMYCNEKSKHKPKKNKKTDL